MKRIYDVVFAVLLLIISFPIMVFAALGISISSKGPIIYSAKRVGKGGVPFTIYKFRTMRVDSGQVRLTTLKDDDRIYPFGRFLRKSKIDELPQLVNILLNQMSVVGPRPEDVAIAEEIYTGKYKAIYSVKPGLTSPASLFDFTHGENYKGYEEYKKEFLPLKLDMELFYVQNNNIWYDIQVTLRTALIIILNVLGKKDFKYPKEYYAIQNFKKEG